MPISKHGTPIQTLEDWETCAGPDSPDHWSDGRSAKETARAWLDGEALDLPKELKTALKHHDAFGKVSTWSGEPEAKLPFHCGTPDVGADEGTDGEQTGAAHRAVGSGGACFDANLVVDADDDFGRYLIVVNGKSDEPFGDTVGDALAAAVEATLDGDRSDGVGRITDVAAAVFGPRRGDDPPLKDIRLELMTASAACIAEASRRGHVRALLLIQEFVTDRTVDKKLLLNSIDLGRFVKRLSHGAFKGIGAGDIVGPIHVPGASPISAKIDFYIGKISRNSRSRRA